MSQPYGQQPQGGYNQGPGYGQQQPPPGYGQPGPGGPGGFGGAMPPAPPEYTAGPVSRPGGVTAAAVLAFVQAGITLICTVFALIIFGAVSSAADEAESQYGITIDKGMLALGWIVAIAGVVGAGLLIWAGVKTLSGTAGKLMIIAAGLQILLCIVWFAALGGDVISILLLVMPVISLSLVLTGAAKQYEASKKGQLA